MAYAEPKTWSQKETMASSDLNTYLRDNLIYLKLHEVPTGTLLPSALSTAPTGYLLCKGQAVSRSTYSDLFTAIGTTFGSGNGSTTFNVPDLQGKTMFGVSDTDSSFDLADTGGSKTINILHSHTVSHSHTISSEANHDHGGATGAIASTINYNTLTAGAANIIQDHTHGITAGGSHDHGGATGTTNPTTSDGLSATQSILNPFLTLNFIIKI